MFFGRGGSDKIENISLDNLPIFLNDTFDKRLGNLEMKASYLVAEMEASKRSFIEACERFEKSLNGPDLEYMRVASQTFIKEQKGAYTTALRRMFVRQVDKQHENAYIRYKAKLDEIETIINEILKINNKFKAVLQAYSNELDMFKSSFSSMEKHAKALRYEIDSRAREFEEYRSVMGNVDKILAFYDELEMTNKARAELENKSATKETDASALRTTESARESKVAELALISKSISEIKSKAQAMLAPLDKAARKYEHGLHVKRPISYYLDSPIEHFSRNRVEYTEFSKSISSLKKEIESGKIDLKNRSGIQGAIDFVLSGALMGLVEEVEMLDDKKRPIQSEVSELELVGRDLTRAERSKTERNRSISEIKGDIERINKAIEMTKRSIEELFLKYYKKRVNITL